MSYRSASETTTHTSSSKIQLDTNKKIQIRNMPSKSRRLSHRSQNKLRILRMASIKVKVSPTEIKRSSNTQRLISKIWRPRILRRAAYLFRLESWRRPHWATRGSLFEWLMDLLSLEESFLQVICSSRLMSNRLDGPYSEKTKTFISWERSYCVISHML